MSTVKNLCEQYFRDFPAARFESELLIGYSSSTDELSCINSDYILGSESEEETLETCSHIETTIAHKAVYRNMPTRIQRATEGKKTENLSICLNFRHAGLYLSYRYQHLLDRFSGLRATIWHHNPPAVRRVCFPCIPFSCHPSDPAGRACVCIVAEGTLHVFLYNFLHNFVNMEPKATVWKCRTSVVFWNDS